MLGVPLRRADRDAFKVSCVRTHLIRRHHCCPALHPALAVAHQLTLHAHRGTSKARSGRRSCACFLSAAASRGCERGVRARARWRSSARARRCATARRGHRRGRSRRFGGVRKAAAAIRDRAECSAMASKECHGRCRRWCHRQCKWWQGCFRRCFGFGGAADDTVVIHDAADLVSARRGIHTRRGFDTRNACAATGGATAQPSARAAAASTTVDEGAR